MFSRKLVSSVLGSLRRVHQESSLSPKALKPLKAKSNVDRQNSHFVDWRRVSLEAGDGGKGCIAFLHVFGNPNAGPCGGNGGNGGHIIFESSYEVTSLEHIPRNLIRAFDGQPGLGSECHGANGKHLFLNVPVGTLIKAEDGTILADMSATNLKFLAARGGQGGKGNKHYLSNENRHPYVCQEGAAGERKAYNLEMKIMAHAGMIGFPNAGKSSLLQAISRARPRVASYPFTTLKPHVGIIDFDDYERVAVADLPGIIEDAHKNRGLGIEFLRHADRCECLIYVIDLSEPAYDEHLRILRNELECYKAGFTRRISVIVANKIDLLSRDEVDARVQHLLSAWNVPIIPISAKFGTNISACVNYLRRTYDRSRAVVRPSFGEFMDDEEKPV